MSLEDAFRAALRSALVSTGELAEEAGYSRVTFERYLNRRPPSREAALALAEVLDRRGGELAEHAHRIREAAGDSGRAAP